MRNNSDLWGVVFSGCVGCEGLNMTPKEIMKNIEQEGFLKNVEDGRFSVEVLNVILNDYAKRGMGEFELGQMWKVFAKLSENGVETNDLPSQELYLKLAKEVVSSSRKADSIDTVNKTKFLVSGLESFDSSRYFLGALNNISTSKDTSTFYADYANFIKTIAEVCPYEQLTYAILTEQIQRKDHPADDWNERTIWLEECGQDLRKKLHYLNHFDFSDYKENHLFGQRIEDLMEKHSETSEGLLSDATKEAEKYPVLIKKPSKRIYVPSPSFYYTSER